MILDILTVFLTVALVENYVFSQMLGICPFLGVSKKPSTALGMGLAVTFVITLSNSSGVSDCLPSDRALAGLL